MADWRKNKTVGLVAGIVSLVCVVVVIAIAVQRIGAAKAGVPTESQKQELMQKIQKADIPPPPEK